MALEALDENIFERAQTAIDGQETNQPLLRVRVLQTVARTLDEIGLFEPGVTGLQSPR